MPLTQQDLQLIEQYLRCRGLLGQQTVVQSSGGGIARRLVGRAEHRLQQEINELSTEISALAGAELVFSVDFTAEPSQSIPDDSNVLIDGKTWVTKQIDALTSLDIVNGTGLVAVYSNVVTQPQAANVPVMALPWPEIELWRPGKRVVVMAELVTSFSVDATSIYLGLCNAVQGTPGAPDTIRSFLAGLQWDSVAAGNHEWRSAISEFAVVNSAVATGALTETVLANYWHSHAYNATWVAPGLIAGELPAPEEFPTNGQRISTSQA